MRGDGGTKMQTLKDLAPADWPREKLMEGGPAHLSNIELLAVVLGRGQPGKDVLTLAGEVVDRLSGLEAELTLDTLLEIKGIGFPPLPDRPPEAQDKHA
jgi:DNA repair protein RadC